MPVSCGRYIDALWANEERSNAWVWLRGSGWRKLDDRNDDACTDILAIAAAAKKEQWAVSVHEETRDGHPYITEIYDFPTGVVGPTEEVELLRIRVRLRLDGRLRAARYADHRPHPSRPRRRDLRDDDGHASRQVEGRDREQVERPVRLLHRSGLYRPLRTDVRVEWVTSGEHHRVRVRVGPARSNMTTWDTQDSGDAASHEFGHMLGHPDEYSDSSCPNRTPVNTGTVMDDNTEVVERLCRRSAIGSDSPSTRYERALGPPSKDSPAGAPFAATELAAKLRRAVDDDEARRKIRVRLEVEGGQRDERYHFLFTSTGVREAEAGVHDRLRDRAITAKSDGARGT